MNANDTLLAVLPNIRAQAHKWARGDREFEEELAQTIAERFLASWSRFRWDGTLRHAGGWVAGIARTVAFNARRKEATYRRHLTRLASGETSGYTNPPRKRPKKPTRPHPTLF